jgi:hypothetical protein
MSLKLEALYPPEGVGIVRKGQTLRLIRPPYLLHDSPSLPEDSVRDAILKYGFFASGQEFPSWEEMIDFLNSQVVESRRALGKEVPEFLQDTDLLDVAPKEVIANFLARVEEELIPQGLFEHAENLLLALLKSDALARDPEFARAAANLLSINKESRARAEAKVEELASRDVRFVRLDDHQREKSAKIAADIKARHSVFALAS